MALDDGGMNDSTRTSTDLLIKDFNLSLKITKRENNLISVFR